MTPLLSVPVVLVSVPPSDLRKLALTPLVSRNCSRHEATLSQRRVVSMQLSESTLCHSFVVDLYFGALHLLRLDRQHESLT